MSDESNTPARIAVRALRDLAKHHDYTAEQKRREARMLEREASIHSSLWASLDNMADAIEISPGEPELQALLSILREQHDRSTTAARIDDIHNGSLVERAAAAWLKSEGN